MGELILPEGITPYYHDREVGIVLYCGDCREILPNMQAGSVDLVLTDPPYGVNLTKKTSDFRGSSYFDNGESLRASILYSDNPDQVRTLIAEVMPMLQRVGRRMVIFPGSRMLWAYPEPSTVGCVFIPNGAGRAPWGFQCMQPILFYGRDPYIEDGLGGRPNSFRTEQPNRENIDHPCPKPLSWMEWCVARASREAEVVLDPFAGSGTTLLAAKNLGRCAIGIEVEERYCEIAVNRLRQSVLPLHQPAPVAEQLALEVAE